ncbi:hypothetical protein [Streptomyces yangpuensis]|uniref:hypothetical protein n=1 Tax=Streptomyces yangpuensis TaxID=1648182 RepID=UPI003652388D
MTAVLLPGRGASARRPVARGPRGRGRPLALRNAEQIEQLLADIAAGATVPEAAASAGLSRTPVYSLRRTDPQFAAALSLAQRAGRKARRSAGPQLQVDEHGSESSYTKRHCPCAPCRAAGSSARARRRAAARELANNPTTTAA